MDGMKRAACCVLVLACIARSASGRPEDLAANDINAHLPPAKTEVTSVAPAAAAVVSAENARPVNEQFPHAVLFGRTCGGSIIGAKWILTAAHCTLFVTSRHVLAGTNNTEDGTGVAARVKKMYVHPRFSVGPYWLDADQYGIKQVAARWDFLLAELTEPLPLDGKKIAAVPLDETLKHGSGEPAGYAGYGAESHGDVMREDMHGMSLELQADDSCAAQLEQYDPFDMICAKGRPPRYDAACNGDSGSGLVSGGKLVGIASWVQNDAFECRNGNLVVFSRVARVRDWIREITGI